MTRIEWISADIPPIRVIRVLKMLPKDLLMNEMRSFDKLRINCYAQFNHCVAFELSVATMPKRSSFTLYHNQSLPSYYRELRNA